MTERSPVRAVRAVAAGTLLAGVAAVLTAFTVSAGGDARATTARATTARATTSTTPPPTVSATLTTGSGATR